MSVQQLLAEAQSLTPAERRELIGSLVRMGRERPAGSWEEIERKIQDSDLSPWVAEGDLARALRLEE